MTKQIEQEIDSHLQKIKTADKWLLVLNVVFFVLVGALFAA